MKLFNIIQEIYFTEKSAKVFKVAGIYSSKNIVQNGLAPVKPTLPPEVSSGRIDYSELRKKEMISTISHTLLNKKTFWDDRGLIKSKDVHHFKVSSGVEAVGVYSVKLKDFRTLNQEEVWESLYVIFYPPHPLAQLESEDYWSSKEEKIYFNEVLPNIRKSLIEIQKLEK